MRYRPLGDSGLMVSVTGLGCNNFGRRLDLDATRAVVDAALEAGITLGAGSRSLRSPSVRWPRSPDAPL